MKKKQLVIFGAGGHARVISSIIKETNEWHVAGILDKERDTLGEVIDGYRIIGSWEDFQKIKDQGISHAVIAIGDNKKRKRLFLTLKTAGFMLPTLIHPKAFISRSADIGDGCVICMGALIGTDATIGSNTIINSGAIIEHECTLGSNIHVGPGCRIAGRNTIGADTFVGIGSSVRDKVIIGENVVIGAGSVVINNIPDNLVVCGVPAKTLKCVD